MKKAVISNRIYMSVTPELQEEVNKVLTYKIPPKMPMEPPTIVKTWSRIKPGLVSFPTGRLDLIPEDYEIVDKRILAPIEFPEFKGSLRESQSEIYDQIEDSAIINAQVSWGKTFTALAIAKKLGQKTLVITHTIPLRNQWAREVEKVFGFTPGIIGSGSFNTSTPIVIGNIQTLYRNINKISKEFGTIILDEMHHVSSKTFSAIIDASHARYKIGLSGTIERKDGKHVVFRDYFSPTVYKPPAENFMEPEVHIYNMEVRFPDGKDTPWAKRVNTLCNNAEYKHSVALIASSYAIAGHKVLVVSDRVQFLKDCAALVGDTAMYVVGETQNREEMINKIYTGEKSVLFGTQAIFSEGISVNPLSCLILATPINNEPLLQQLVGRVIREYPNKKSPVVIDLHLKGKTATRQASQRMSFYIKKGFKIKSR